MTSGSLFDDWFDNRQDPAVYDPVASARKAMTPQWPKRFFQTARVGEAEDGFRLLLDGRSAKTPSRQVLALPTRALGEAVAGEWNALGEHIDPRVMPLTRLANAIIAGVAPDPAPVADEIVRYAGSDLLCYRAGEPAGLVAQQIENWDPILAFLRERLGVVFVLSQGVIHADQPPRAIAAVRASLPADPWALGALSVMTTLTGSALGPLALHLGFGDGESLWRAAHVDEDFQISQWGEDDEAILRRAARRKEFDAALATRTLSAA